MNAGSFEPSRHGYVSHGLTLSYVDWGNPDAPTLIFLHGMKDHARSWDRIARALRDGWHVIAADLRGHGDSEWSPDGAYLTPYHMLDLIELVDALGTEPVTLVGHSFGGGVTSRYAALFPDRVRKLAVIEGFGPSDDIYALWKKAGPVERTRAWIAQMRDPKLNNPRRLATIEDGVARMKAGNKRLSDEQARHLTIHAVHDYADGYGWKFDPRVSMFAPEDFVIEPANFWREVSAPTLLCYGSESWAGNPQADGRTDEFTNASVVAIEQAGHWPHHDQPDEFIEMLRAFL